MPIDWSALIWLCYWELVEDGEILPDGFERNERE